jgi:hypothetical protein
MGSLPTSCSTCTSKSVAHTTDDQDFGLFSTVPARAIGDRVVLTRGSDEDTSWLFLYPKDEVLFGVNGHGGVSMAEALPICRRASVMSGDDWLDIAESFEPLPAEE